MNVKIFLVSFLILSAFSFESEGRDWENMMTKRDWGRVKESFSGDPQKMLSFVDDDQIRGELDFCLKLACDDDNEFLLEKQKWALAAYFAQMRREDVKFCHGNLDEIMQKFNGGVRMSAGEMYKVLGESLRGGNDLPKTMEEYRIAREKYLEMRFQKNMLVSGSLLLMFLFVCCIFFSMRKRISAAFDFLWKWISAALCSIWKRTKSILCIYRKLSELQKIFFLLSVTSVIMLLGAFMNEWKIWYYTLLRIATCASLGWFLKERFPATVKFPVLILAAIYNPVVQIHFNDRDVWIFFDLITMPVILALWTILLLRMERRM